MARALLVAAVSLSLTPPAGSASKPTADLRPPTALETMLTGYICDAPSSTEPVDDSAREQCRDAQGRALRAEFGYDLSRVSPAERSTLDTGCSRHRTTVDVEPYVKCLAEGLAAIRPRWTPEKLSRMPTLVSQAAVASAAPHADPAPRRSFLLTPPLLAAAGAVVGLAGVAGVVVMTRRRRPQHVCGECGSPMESAGDFCVECRRRAAAALKQAKLDSAEQARAEQEALRRTQAEEEERQRHQAELEVRRMRNEAAGHTADAQARPHQLAVLSDPNDDSY
jgi:hypothetical protein